MPWIFEIKDKLGRRIHLSKERWSHINQQHPEIANFKEIKETLENPTKITNYSYDENIKYYYKYSKDKKSPVKYLLVIVKYLNNEGFIITAYAVRGIK